MQEFFVLAAFVFVFPLLSLVVDTVLGVRDALSSLPSWKVIAHETWFMLGGLFAGTLLRLLF